jgi:hypothetical protein
VAKDSIMISVINDDDVYTIGTSDRDPSLYKFIVSLAGPESTSMRGLWVREYLA